jgi:hypothetical protein
MVLALLPAHCRLFCLIWLLFLCLLSPCNAGLLGVVYLRPIAFCALSLAYGFCSRMVGDL